MSEHIHQHIIDQVRAARVDAENHAGRVNARQGSTSECTHRRCTPIDRLPVIWDDGVPVILPCDLGHGFQDAVVDLTHEYRGTRTFRLRCGHLYISDNADGRQE